MSSARQLRRIACLALAWFMLSIGVAVASPLVQPRGMELVCSGAGVMKLLVKNPDGSSSQAGHSLDCPLCASVAPPPPRVFAPVPPPLPLAYALRPVVRAIIAARTAAPPPGRGPPSFS